MHAICGTVFAVSASQKENPCQRVYESPGRLQAGQVKTKENRGHGCETIGVL